MSYKDLYIKYKYKYLQLKEMIGQGNEQIPMLINEIFDIPEYNDNNIQHKLNDITQLLSNRCIQLAEPNKYKCEMIMLILTSSVSKRIEEIKKNRNK